MKKTHYRILALCLSLILLTSLTSGVSLAAGGECGEGVRWDYEDGQLTISGSGYMYDWSDSGETPWADYNTHITRVSVGDGVISIGSGAFSDLYNLTEISFGNRLRRIGDMAFSNCIALGGFTLPDSLESVGSFAFASDYSVTKIAIPASVSHIGYGAFADMKALTEITVANGNTHFASDSGALYTSGPAELITCPAGLTGSFTMPETVTSIGIYALMGCQITSISLPESLRTIGEEAFNVCGNLRQIEIPRNVQSIGDSAFNECALISITVADGNRYYSADDGILYNYSGDRLICYPIGRDATDFNVPDRVTAINDYAFAYSKLKSVTVGDGVEKIGNYSFAFCEALENLNIGRGLVSVGDYAFSNCIKLKKVVLPSACETIATGAFSWCEELESVILNSPVYIGSSAFYWCTNLKRVEFRSDAPKDVGDDIFYACEDAMIYYPADAKGWSTPTWHGYLTTPMTVSTVEKGDIDGNGEVNNADLVLLARYVVGLGQVNMEAADMDGNGEVDNSDLVTLARHIVGL